MGEVIRAPGPMAKANPTGFPPSLRRMRRICFICYEPNCYRKKGRTNTQSAVQPAHFTRRRDRAAVRERGQTVDRASALTAVRADSVLGAQASPTIDTKPRGLEPSGLLVLRAVVWRRSPNNPSATPRQAESAFVHDAPLSDPENPRLRTRPPLLMSSDFNLQLSLSPFALASLPVQRWKF